MTIAAAEVTKSQTSVGKRGEPMQKQKLEESPCIRCGKIRVVSRVWTEKIDRGNPITHTETVCPDKECQSIVDADFAAKREKKLLLTANREESKQLNKAALAASKIAA